MNNHDYFHQESQRLTYRKLTKDDIPQWVHFFENNHSLDFLGLDLTQSKEEMAESWILKQFDRYQTQNLGHLAVELKENGAFIGMCGILPQEVNDNVEYEIAYSLLPEYWGQGYGTEMALQMKQYGFEILDIHRLISIIDIRNTKSINVARKNGMEVLFRTEKYGLTVDIYGMQKED